MRLILEILRYFCDVGPYVDSVKLHDESNFIVHNVSPTHIRATSLVQIMACRLTGAKPLSEPMLSLGGFTKNAEQHMCRHFITVASHEHHGVSMTSNLIVHSTACDVNAHVAGGFPSQMAVMRDAFPYHCVIMHTTWATQTDSLTNDSWNTCSEMFYQKHLMPSRDLVGKYDRLSPVLAEGVHKLIGTAFINTVIC